MWKVRKVYRHQKNWVLKGKISLLVLLKSVAKNFNFLLYLYFVPNQHKQNEFQ